jgi:hypothetical protein
VKLVVDNENISELPVGNLMDVADMARRFAKHIDNGEWDCMVRCVVVVETEAGMTIIPWGESSSPFELMGMFEAAKLRVFADTMVDDD